MGVVLEKHLVRYCNLVVRRHRHRHRRHPFFCLVLYVRLECRLAAGRLALSQVYP